MARMLSLMMILAWALTPGLSAAFTISGTITGGSSPLSGATVTLYTGDRATVLGTTSTDSSGAYSFTAGNGTYDLKIDPPGASGFRSSWVNDVLVSGSNIVQNIVLVSTPVTVSGTVRWWNGTPVTDARLGVLVNDTTNFNSVAQLFIDNQGHYSFTISPGVYNIAIEFGAGFVGLPPSGIPAVLSLEPLLQAVSITDDRTLDLILPIVVLNGRTLDENGQPLAGVAIKSDVLVTSGGCFHRIKFGYDSTLNPVSDANGRFRVGIFRGVSMPLQFVPPQACTSGLLNTSCTLTTDSEVSFKLPARTAVSGRIRTRSGIPLERVIVSFMQNNSGALEIETDENGDYYAPLSAGTYGVRYYKFFNSLGNVPNTPCWVMSSSFAAFQTTNTTLTANKVVDAELPLVLMRGRTVNQSGQPVGNVQINTTDYETEDFPEYDMESWIYDMHNYTSDAQGNYAVLLLADHASKLRLNPPAGTSSVVTVVNTPIMTTDTLHDLTLLEGHKLSGTLYVGNRIPADNVEVRIENTSDTTINCSAITDHLGHFEFPLSSGTYSIRAYISGGTHVNFPAPTMMSTDYIKTVTIGSTDVSCEVQLPLFLLSGRVTDCNGIGVAGVRLSGNIFNGAYSITSDSNGFYQTYTMGTVFTELISPPAGSGFGETLIGGFTLTQDTLQNIILNFTDSVAPRIICGPYAKSITNNSAVIEWQTDEPANSTVNYGLSSVNESTATLTDFTVAHSVQLTGLDADTIYKFQASSTDPSGNGPVESRMLTFKTLAAPDTTQPRVTEGPILDSITARSARVEWITDEPATSVVRYGTTPSVDQVTSCTAFTERHVMTLNSLTTDTLYYVRVGGVDRAGNQTTGTVTATFTTRKSMDCTPPVITAGPLAINIGAHEATISWTTDEPASSGVSLNDGTKYKVFTDEALTLEHMVHVTGLDPATRYYYTASSTDGFGNGPTLSKTQQFKTLAAPDTKPPLLIRQPDVKNVTEQSALISWETDEPADGVVDYGTSTTLGQTVINSQLIRRHTVPLVHLIPNTLYYARVSSTDALGNGPTTSTLITFTTRKQKEQRVPVITDGPAAVKITNRGATIYWETNTACDSVVIVSGAGESTLRFSCPDKVTEHRISLTNLTPNKNYQIVVMSTDIEGNTVQSGLTSLDSGLRLADAPELITSSLPDTTAPVISTGPQVIALSATRAAIRWVTNEPADSRLNYGLGGDLSLFAGSTEMRREHVVILTNLTASTSYSYCVASQDDCGNGPTTSATASFTTAATEDATPPAIGAAPILTLVNNMRQISWSGAEPTYGFIDYGTVQDPANWRSGFDLLAGSHEVMLPCIPNNSDLAYTITSVDLMGNTSTYSGTIRNGVGRGWTMYR